MKTNHPIRLVPHWPFKALLLALVASWTLPCAAELQVWFAPNSAVGHSSPEHGFSKADPHTFEWSWVKQTVLNDRQPDRTVVLNFMPGTHQNVYIGDVSDLKWDPPATFTAEPARWRLTIQGTESRAENTVLLFPNQFWTGADGYVSLIELVGDSKKKIDYARIVVQNLTLDGNWDQQKWSGPEFLGGYKLQPLRIFARTARIRNVIVRNYGAHGPVPQTANLASGTEIFPLWVSSADVGQEPEDGDPRPIVIEDCELTGLHSVYGGYCTAIAVNPRVTREKTKANYVSETFSTDPNRRLALVRRNQIRGYNPIATGGSGGRSSELRGVTITGNVALGSGIFMNTDTGVISYVDLTNNLALGVGGILNHGWPLTEFKFGHHHYNVSGNAVRFGGPWTFPLYQNYTWIDGKQVTDDQKLILGRMDTNQNAGLIFAGASSDTTMVGNWFTTDTSDRFNRVIGSNAVFRILWKYDNQELVGESWPAFPRSPSGNVTLKNNSISSVAYDFFGMQPLEENGQFESFNPSTAPLHARRRMAISRPPSMFMPDGTVERVVLITSNRPANYTWLASSSTSAKKEIRSMSVPLDKVTVGALEVTIGVASTTNGLWYRVPVRVAMQPTPASGLKHTEFLAGRTVRLEASVNGASEGNRQGVTDTSGVAMVLVPVRPTNAAVHLRAWVDAGLGSPGVFDEYQDAWASSDISKGSVVSFEASPDVARLSTGQRGRFHFSRTGTREQLQRPLNVRVMIASNLPNAAQLGSDFRMVAGPGGKWSETDAGNSGTLTFSPGNSEVDLDVVATGSSGRDHRVIHLNLSSSTAGDYVTAKDGDARSDRPPTMLLLYK